VNADDRFTLIPLWEERGRYRDVFEGGGTLGPLTGNIGVRALLKRTCIAQEQDIEVKGRLYRSAIYVLTQDSGRAYVETDGDGVPTSAREIRMWWADSWTGLLADDMFRRWRVSDGINPETRVLVDSGFIPPALEWLDEHDSGDGAPGDKQALSWEALKCHSRILVVGDPGAGKTTLLRRLVYETKESAAQRADTIPVYLQLREISPRDLGEEGLVRLLLREGVSRAEAEFKAPLMGGRLLLLLDGLDEVAEEHREEMLRRIEALAAETPSIRMVVTSRPLEHQGRLADFAKMRVLPFNRARVAQWVYQFLITRVPDDRRQALIEEMLTDPQVEEVLSNPLFLSMVSNLYAENQVRLYDRARIFDSCIDLLLQNWDLTRGIRRWQSDVTAVEVKRTLSALSASLLDAHTDEFTVDDVTQLLRTKTGFPRQPLVLLDACRSAGVIQPAGADRYVFTHQTFKEYLAASHLVGETSDSLLYLQGHGGDPEAGRVWLLSCSMASDADRLLKGAMEGSALPEGKTAALLAGALSHSLAAPSNVVRQCCDFIVGWLERRLGPPPLQLEQLRADAVTEKSWPWHMRVDLDADDGDCVPDLLEVVALVHKARRGGASELLVERMTASSVPLVRRLADAMSVEGVMRCDVAPADGQTPVQIEFFVRPFMSEASLGITRISEG
jgi:hypothetical protein